MNNVNLVGRLTKDVEVRYSSASEPIAIGRFTIAVNRIKKGEADFINCVAFGKTAENIQKFFTKGSQIGIVGKIQTGSYEKDGIKHYTTDILVNDFDILDKKQDGQAQPQQQAEDFSDLPF